MTGPVQDQQPAQTPTRSGVTARVDRREEVARWLHEQYGEHTQPNSARVDALLPLIARFEREAAAKALNDAADDRPGHDERFIRAYLRDRAAALTDVDGVQS